MNEITIEHIAKAIKSGNKDDINEASLIKNICCFVY
jgi:hypothetical protein